MSGLIGTRSFKLLAILQSNIIQMNQTEYSTNPLFIDKTQATSLKDDGTVFRVVEKNCWCPLARIAECDKSGVTMQVLSTVPGIGFNYGKPVEQAIVVARFLNDHIAEVVRQHPDRFMGLGTVPLQEASVAIEEMKRCMAELGLAGIQIGSHVDGMTLDDPFFDPFWKVVEELQCPVFVHPWDMGNEPRLQKY